MNPPPSPAKKDRALGGCKERYDPDEWFFPGSEFVDGTLQGAMKAGLEAYPIMRDTL
jgi:hypothetical protein